MTHLELVSLLDDFVHIGVGRKRDDLDGFRMATCDIERLKADRARRAKHDNAFSTLIPIHTNQPFVFILRAPQKQPGRNTTLRYPGAFVPRAV